MVNMSYCRHELMYFKKFFEIAQDILDNEEVKERMLEWYSENAE